MFTVSEFCFHSNFLLKRPGRESSVSLEQWTHGISSHHSSSQLTRAATKRTKSPSPWPQGRGHINMERTFYSTEIWAKCAKHLHNFSGMIKQNGTNGSIGLGLFHCFSTKCKAGKRSKCSQQTSTDFCEWIHFSSFWNFQPSISTWQLSPLGPRERVATTSQIAHSVQNTEQVLEVAIPSLCSHHVPCIGFPAVGGIHHGLQDSQVQPWELHLERPGCRWGRMAPPGKNAESNSLWKDGEKTNGR